MKTTPAEMAYLKTPGVDSLITIKTILDFGSKTDKQIHCKSMFLFTMFQYLQIPDRAIYHTFNNRKKEPL